MRLLLSVLLVLCSACESTDFRPCPITHTDPTKQLYNDVLIDLIEQRLYDAYLPEEYHQVVATHFAEGGYRELTAADLSWRHAQQVHFQHHLFQDTARFQTFYLRTARASKTQLADLPTQFAILQAGSQASAAIAALITALAPQQQQATLDSLNAVQRHMPAQEFQFCTAKLLPERAFQPGKNDARITLSAVVFNAPHDQALLSYGWQCGPKCGFGEVLWVEKVKGRWHIKQAQGTWIS